MRQEFQNQTPTPRVNQNINHAENVGRPPTSRFPREPVGTLFIIPSTGGIFFRASSRILHIDQHAVDFVDTSPFSIS